MVDNEEGAKERAKAGRAKTKPQEPSGSESDKTKEGEQPSESKKSDSRPALVAKYLGVSIMIALLVAGFIQMYFEGTVSPVLILGIPIWALIWFLILLSIDDDDKTPFAVFAGYILVAAAVGGVLTQMSDLRPTESAGWTTEEITDGPFIVRFQTESKFALSPFEYEQTPVTINVTLWVTERTLARIDGAAVIVIKAIDPPLSLKEGEPIVKVLTNDTRSDSFELEFDPIGGLTKQNYNVIFQVDYRLWLFGEYYNGTKPAFITIQVEGQDFASGWYLIFIFTGILASFWWRLANEFFDDEIKGKKKSNWRKLKGNKRIAYFLFLPGVSLLIALVVFRQFQESLGVSIDPIVTAVGGFTFGFFWESVANKFGGSITIGKKRIPEKEDGKQPPVAENQGEAPNQDEENEEKGEPPAQDDQNKP
jgi:hypothetical protein